MQNWLDDKKYTSINVISKTHEENFWIAQFSKCTNIPMIIINMLGHWCHALIDTGACRSLLSEVQARVVLGDFYRSKIEKTCKLILQDVNNKPLNIKGQIDIQFNINDHKFIHTFVICQGTSTDVLLGYDFLLKNQLCVAPNLGIFFKNDIEKINRLALDLDSFPVVATKGFTLLPFQQQVITVKVISKNEKHKNLLSENKVIISSEGLEPNKHFTELSVVHQYLSLTSTLDAQLVIINPSNEIKYYKSQEIVGFAFFCDMVRNIKNQQTYSVCHAVHDLLSIADSKTIHINEEKIILNNQEFSLDLDSINCHSKIPADIKWIKQLHTEYKEIFTTKEFSPGTAQGTEVHFEVRSEATIIQQKFNRLNPMIRKEAVEIIDTLLSRKLIELSDSPWSSRVIFVHKAPDEMQVNEGHAIAGIKKANAKRKLRLVLDLRDVNRRLKSINTSYNPPTIWSIIDRLYKAQYLSIMDFNSGFWHFPLSKEAKKLTAFNFGDFKYHCCRLPQGLKISSSIMQHKMMKLIAKYGLKDVIIYIDNVLCFGNNKDNYQNNLKAFFNACKIEGYKLKTMKSHHFINESVILFGFNINLKSKTVGPEPEKIDKLVQIPKPQNKRQVRAFIGGITYFSNFIEKLQVILGPLHHLASKTSKFEWTQECEKAFIDIKNKITQLPLVFLFNTNLPLHVVCDGAQSSHIAYVLYQKNSEGQFCPIKFNSHKLSSTEAKMSQYETEALALIFVLIKEEHWLSFGGAIIHTDAKSLCYITRFNKTTSKLARWNILLNSFDITISFLPNSNAQVKFTDLLTRQGGKAVFKNKVPEKLLKEFVMIDFSGLPDMHIKDVIHLLSEIYENIEQKNLLKLTASQTVLPEVPCRKYQISPHFSMDAHVNCIMNVHHDTNWRETLPDVSLPIVTDENAKRSGKIKEAIVNFIPDINKNQLIIAQHEDKHIETIINKINSGSADKSFFIFERLLMKKKLLNGNNFDLLVLPLNMALYMLQNIHKNLHLGVEAMMRQVYETFYVSNLKKICQDLISKCRFCLLNKPFANKPLEPGMRFIVQGPRQLLYVDVCVIDASKPKGSFLNIVDGFTKFVLLTACKQNPTAEEIADIIMQTYVKTYGFPKLLCGDGASYFSNRKLGEVCALLGCKFVKIAPYNSKANLSERYHRIVINALRMLQQTTKVTTEHFDNMLVVAGQMINGIKNRSNYSPFYLQHGTKPRQNLITWMTPDQALSKHARSLIDCQNVCYSIYNAKQLQNNKTSIQQPETFYKGQFVLLKKKSIGPSRIGHKLRPIYHQQPFRIVRRTVTNALLVPYGKKSFKERFFREGEIPKKLCRLVKITDLKPIKSIWHYLKLNVHDVNILNLQSLLKSDNEPINEVQICPTNKFKHVTKEIQSFRNQLLECTDGDINEVSQLKTYDSDIMTTDSFSTIKIQCKPQKKIVSSCDSTTRPAFSYRDEYISDDLDYESIQNLASDDENSSSSDTSSEASVISVITKPNSQTSTIKLPSGRHLTIHYKPNAQDSIMDRQSVAISRPVEEECIVDI